MRNTARKWTRGYGFRESDLGTIAVSEYSIRKAVMETSAVLGAFEEKTRFLRNLKRMESWEEYVDVYSFMYNLVTDYNTGYDAARDLDILDIPACTSLQMFLIAVRLNELAQEKFGLVHAFLCTDDVEGETGILFLPFLYPWDMEDVNRMPSKDDIAQLYNQALRDLFGEEGPEIEMRYYEADS